MILMGAGPEALLQPITRQPSRLSFQQSTFGFNV
jgi:hypothetical protein